ncbi:MAG: hypothetical protein KGL39_34325 [Patescibacteria group bacterium]|nr:hypothetical protein [Patescibacteria group bacterium]
MRKKIYVGFRLAGFKVVCRKDTCIKSVHETREGIKPFQAHGLYCSVCQDWLLPQPTNGKAHAA